MAGEALPAHLLDEVFSKDGRPPEVLNEDSRPALTSPQNVSGSGQKTRLFSDLPNLSEKEEVRPQNDVRRDVVGRWQRPAIYEMIDQQTRRNFPLNERPPVYRSADCPLFEVGDHVSEQVSCDELDIPTKSLRTKSPTHWQTVHSVDIDSSQGRRLFSTGRKSGGG